MEGQLAIYTPILEEHWRINSLYGLLEAVGRFNLCSAWDMSRVVDAWAAAEFELRPPPLSANLGAFMAWAATLDAESTASCHQALRIVLKVAQRDVREVTLRWLVPSLKWCPACAASATHLIVHQHKAVTFCPAHGIRLLTYCGNCGASSPYRIGRTCRLFQCIHCGWRVSGGDTSSTKRMERDRGVPKPPPADLQVRPAAETVLIPGLPDCRQASVSQKRHESLAQDLRIMHGERVMARRSRSESSTILARYFNFRQQHMPTEVASRTNDDHLDLLHVMRQVAELAMLSGHACLMDAHGRFEHDYRNCPCGAGYRLWLQRLRYSANRSSTFGLRRETYEASHVGLCLSTAWYASAQSAFSDDQMLYASLVQLLVPSIGSLGAAQAADDGQGGRVATLDHRFQWFAVRCPHGARRTLQRRGALEAMGRALPTRAGSLLDAASWIAS